ncbi:hypothetical protein GCM10010393_30290 [Streptomyces gobitricini]|uniref:Uncharacterized protein n=1 Tax=Streptomyces gobitricini TaxID=68211 RepID=A0ABP5ZEE3_9ACTN
MPGSVVRPGGAAGVWWAPGGGDVDSVPVNGRRMPRVSSGAGTPCWRSARRPGGPGGAGAALQAGAPGTVERIAAIV